MEAELVGARGSSNMIGTLEYEGEQEYQGEESDDGTASKLTDSEPGQWWQLPKGIKANPIQWNRPNTNFDMFMKRILRGIAAGLPGASYNILADDMESVNFSSARIGLMEPREVFKALQRWFITDILEPIYEDWLEVQLAGGLIPLPLSKIDKFKAVRWCGRRWSYIEPEKEVDAAIKRINSGISSLGQELEALGEYDLDGHLDRLAEEQKAIEGRKLTLPEILKAALKTPPEPKPPVEAAAA
jgi:lambda family phage portal protein